MSKPLLVITAVVLEGRSKSEVARDYDVSRYWVHQLVNASTPKVPGCSAAMRDGWRAAGHPAPPIHSGGPMNNCPNCKATIGYIGTAYICPSTRAAAPPHQPGVRPTDQAEPDRPRTVRARQPRSPHTQAAATKAGTT